MRQLAAIVAMGLGQLWYWMGMKAMPPNDGAKLMGVVISLAGLAFLAAGHVWPPGRPKE